MGLLSRMDFKKKSLSQIAEDNIIFAIENLWRLGLIEKDFSSKDNSIYKISELGNRFLEINNE